MNHCTPTACSYKKKKGNNYILVSIAAVSVRRIRASVGEKVYFWLRDFREIKLMVSASVQVLRLQKCCTEKLGR